MPLSSGPTGSRYRPPEPSNTDPRDVAAAIASLVEDRVARNQEIRTAVQKTGCDGHPEINPLDGTSCAPIGGPMVLTSGGWLFEARIPRNLSGAGGNFARVSETILGTPCDRQNADVNRRLRFLDSEGNLFDQNGLFLSTGNTPATLPTDPIWYYRPRIEGALVQLKKADNSVILTPLPRYYVGEKFTSAHVGGIALGANESSTCFGDPNVDLVLTTEAANFDGNTTAGSHGLAIRSAETLQLLGWNPFQYATSNFNWTGGHPNFAITATEDGSWWVHLYGTSVLSTPPDPWPNWEYVTPFGIGADEASTPGVPNYLIQRVTVDRSQMKASIVESRRVYAHPEMTAWDATTFLTAYLEDEGS